MTDTGGPQRDGEIIVEESRTIANAVREARGLSRPPLPQTRKLAEPRDIIAVDLDERMDEAAAVEAAEPKSDNLWFKVIRALIVGCTSAIAWWLLPPESPSRPPIKLPEALQSEIASVAPSQAAAEAKALKIFAEDGPEEAIDDLLACIDPGPATHRAWRTFLTALAQRHHDGDLLKWAQAYAAKYPDRLESAHFIAAARLRQDIDSQRKGRFFHRVSAEFKSDLESAQTRLAQARALLDDHENDWSYKERAAWHDALLLDSAQLYQKQWQCEETPFEHELRDKAIAALEQMHEKDARNALQLKRDIYARIKDKWPLLSLETHIGGKDCDSKDLTDLIKDLDEKLKKPVDGK